jgi:hypothetical protein
MALLITTALMIFQSIPLFSTPPRLSRSRRPLLGEIKKQKPREDMSRGSKSAGYRGLRFSRAATPHNSFLDTSRCQILSVQFPPPRHRTETKKAEADQTESGGLGGGYGDIVQGQKARIVA